MRSPSRQLQEAGIIRNIGRDAGYTGAGFGTAVTVAGSPR
jgi:hypothetical protein